RQLIVPRHLLGRVTSTVRLLFLTADPVGVVIAGSLTAALGGNPRPVFAGAGVTVAITAAAGWGAGLRRGGAPGGARWPWGPFGGGTKPAGPPPPPLPAPPPEPPAPPPP